jgi:hypothetical protein
MGGSITIPLTSCLTGLEMTTDSFCFYLQNRLIQISQIGGQWYGDTSPFGIPCLKVHLHYGENRAKLVRFKEQKKIFCISKTL